MKWNNNYIYYGVNCDRSSIFTLGETTHAGGGLGRLAEQKRHERLAETTCFFLLNSLKIVLSFIVFE